MNVQYLTNNTLLNMFDGKYPLIQRKKDILQENFRQFNEVKFGMFIPY